ncbi:hypothetical protein EON65_41210 [archaeon]|nr:MAG: hypothetical protein EON65_41210 [archaeon]
MTSIARHLKVHKKAGTKERMNPVVVPDPAQPPTLANENLPPPNVITLHELQKLAALVDTKTLASSIKTCKIHAILVMNESIDFRDNRCKIVELKIAPNWKTKLTNSFTW